jgi:hypothetical protein
MASIIGNLTPIMQMIHHTDREPHPARLADLAMSKFLYHRVALCDCTLNISNRAGD